ncbi:hypothetical protein P168DRAFT_316724 [Aspergillus campestris IBT 28561]|uniref:Uncharacterized protein n=1 Tax=Aspergillus campestris (strain IBT 28561) TaxID=1392248 RepID=A0A2I1DA58_ASPC2|nr:uncharacterized protein P168DRAFT_316724 [Aspergillus campestris IBT 28561]PKY06742.1 hypothetical protein P168DRAFT_316724 [Aspergillus campestris IBT 28561]
MPLLLGWDLFHSPPRAGCGIAAKGQHLAFLNHFPAALLLGFLAPILGAAFLYPTVISFDQSQMLIALWQGWPIWTTALTLTLFSIRKPATLQGSGEKKQATIQDTGQTLHAFAFACAITSHWILCMSSLVSFTGTENSSSLPSLLLPHLPWSHEKPSSIGEGVLWFLQWDYSIAAAATLIWSVTLWLRATSHASVRGSGGTLVLQSAGWSLVSGPCGAAVVLMWRRHRLLSRYCRET